eukprot:SAG22_NODE_602_length_8663_cov_17.617936_6_plen_98_part_00
MTLKLHLRSCINNRLSVPCDPTELCHLRYHEYTLLHEVVTGQEYGGSSQPKLIENKARVLYHVVCSGIPNLKDAANRPIPMWLGKLLAVCTNRATLV